MKITMISILEKVRAPSRFLVRKGLEWGDGTRLGTSRRLSAEEVILASDDEEQADARQRDVEGPPIDYGLLVEQPAEQVADDETDTQHCEIHDFPPQGTVFSTAPLPQRLSVSCDSDNTANIAYMSLKVKLKLVNSHSNRNRVCRLIATLKMPSILRSYGTYTHWTGRLAGHRSYATSRTPDS